jgi:hypothetical protein
MQTHTAVLPSLSDSAHKRLSPLLVFVVGASVMVPIAPESRVVLFDICAAAVVAFRFGQLYSSPQVRQLVVLFAVYSALLLLSTFLHGLPGMNFVRREYGVVLLVLELLAVYALLLDGEYDQQLLIVAAVMFGMCLHYFYPVDLRVQDEPLKFLLGVPLGVLGAAAISSVTRGYSIGRYVIAIAFLCYAALCVFQGSRAVGATFLVCAVLAFVRLDVVRKKSYRFWFPFILVGGLIGLYLITEAYASLAIAGAFGERAAGVATFQKQVFGTLLLGGRPDIPINLLAIYDSPLVGHGPLDQTQKYLDAFSLLGIYRDEDVADDDQLLYHSMFFTAGHEAGIFAMALWLFLIYKLAFSITAVISLGRRIAMVVVPLMIHAIWDILFSPLNSYNRWTTAVGAALALYWVGKWRGRVLDR